MKSTGWGLAFLLGFAVSAHAEGAAAEGPSLRRYVTVLGSTTVAYRPPGGSFDGLQHDVTPQLGFGYLVTPKIALELDVGPTYIEGDYSGFSLVPGAVFILGPPYYASLRFVIPVDPETNLAVSPGLGALFTLSSRTALYVETNVTSYVGRGDSDLGAGVSVGLLYCF